MASRESNQFRPPCRVRHSSHQQRVTFGAEPSRCQGATIRSQLLAERVHAQESTIQPGILLKTNEEVLGECPPKVVRYQPAQAKPHSLRGRMAIPKRLRSGAARGSNTKMWVHAENPNGMNALLSRWVLQRTARTARPWSLGTPCALAITPTQLRLIPAQRQIAPARGDYKRPVCQRHWRGNAWQFSH